MTEKNWQKYLDEIQFSYFSISLVCLGVFMLLSVSRDFVFSDFQPPTWLLALDLIGIAIFAGALLAASLKWMRSNHWYPRAVEVESLAVSISIVNQASRK